MTAAYAEEQETVVRVTVLENAKVVEEQDITISNEQLTIQGVRR